MNKLTCQNQINMSYSLNSLKGGYIGDYIGDYYRGHLGGYYEFRLQLIWS